MQLAGYAMSWIEHHQVSERLASEAQAASREGRIDLALELYGRAADAEQRASDALDRRKTGTLGISAVSAVSLYYKAAMLERAEELACRWLAVDVIPLFAKEHLRNLLQSIWSERTRSTAPVQFAPGEVLVSVRGGRSRVRGGHHST